MKVTFETARWVVLGVDLDGFMGSIEVAEYAGGEFPVRSSEDEGDFTVTAGWVVLGFRTAHVWWSRLFSWEAICLLEDLGKLFSPFKKSFMFWADFEI